MKRRRQVTEEERRLWRLTVQDAAPLKPDSTQASPPLAESPKPDSPPKPAAQTTPKLRAKTPPRKATSPVLELGKTHQLDGALAQRFRKGSLPIEGVLDLHGLTQEQALDQLTRFLERAQAQGKRKLLVITGKGRGPEAGILRRALPAWLNQARLRHSVLAFSQAQQRHGGLGAFYILLRRSRT